MLTDFVPLSFEFLHQTFLDLFSQSVSKYPLHIAISSHGRKMTYQELDQRSNAMAHHIFDAQTPRKSPVALLLRHDLDSIVTLLGVLKCGLPYTAIDPSLSIDNMQQLIEDSKTGLLVTDAFHLMTAQNVLQREMEVALLNLDEFDFNSNQGALHVNIDAYDIGIIFYTSGSTGRPKGVLWNHQQMVSNSVHHVNDLKILPSDRCLLISSLSFAASRASIYDILAAGATISMFDLKAGGINGLRDWMLSDQVTILRGSLQVFRTLFSELQPGFIFPSLRMVGLGGQPLAYGDAILCRAHTSPHCVFVHAFANTETGVVANFHVTHDTVIDEGILSVGHPLPDKKIFLLDQDKQIVSQDVEGEITIRSDFRSSGYLNRPELSAQKFKHHEDGTTTFFTGDLGYWDKDGNLHLVGRKDDQVKVRGYTINLSEIEAVLYQHPAIKETAAIVMPTELSGGSNKLIVYIVPIKDRALSLEDVRSFLLQKLPGYMFPSHIIFLEKLPQTATGKVNKRALPAVPDRTELMNADLSSNAIEKELVEIWSLLLKQTNVGVHDNFFDLGGDSLLAMRLLIEIEKRFSRRLPLAVVSKAYNIKQQAHILLNEETFDFSSVLIPIRTVGTKKPVFCIGGKGGNPIRFHRLVKYLHPDQPVYFFRSRGFEPGEKISMSIEEIASDYLNEIKRIQTDGPYCFIGESGGGLVALEMAQQLKQRGGETALVVLLDTYLMHLKTGHANLFLNLLRKHFQTLATGGRDGMRAYIKYYAELQSFKWAEFREKQRTKRILSQFGRAHVFQRVEDANQNAGRAYLPKPYSGRVLLMISLRQIQMEEAFTDRGWGQVGIEELILHELDCYHGNILFEPFVQQVAAEIRKYLNDVPL